MKSLSTYLLLMLVMFSISACVAQKIELSQSNIILEAGEPFSPLDYVVSPKSKVEIDNPTNMEIPGDYVVSYGTGKGVVTLSVVVKDTIKPNAILKPVSIAYGETFTPDQFIDKIIDSTAVMVTFEKLPDFSFDGQNQKTMLILTDLGGNITRLEATYSIDGEEAFISDYLDRVPQVIAKFWIFNETVDNYKISGKDAYLIVANEFKSRVENVRDILKINQFLPVINDVIASIDYHLKGIDEITEGLNKNNQRLIDSGYEKLKIGQLLLDRAPSKIENLRK